MKQSPIKVTRIRNINKIIINSKIHTAHCTLHDIWIENWKHRSSWGLTGFLISSRLICFNDVGSFFGSFLFSFILSRLSVTYYPCSYILLYIYSEWEWIKRIHINFIMDASQFRIFPTTLQSHHAYNIRKRAFISFNRTFSPFLLIPRW